MARRKESILQQPWDFLNSSNKKRKSSTRNTKSNVLLKTICGCVGVGMGIGVYVCVL